MGQNIVIEKCWMLLED